jgi:hypothetical protein
MRNSFFTIDKVVKTRNQKVNFGNKTWLVYKNYDHACLALKWHNTVSLCGSVSEIFDPGIIITFTKEFVT